MFREHWKESEYYLNMERYQCKCVANMKQSMLTDSNPNNVEQYFDYTDCKWVQRSTSSSRFIMRTLLHRDDEKKLFRLACMLGRDIWVEKSLDSGHFKDVSEKDEDGNTPIMHCCMQGHYTSVHKFLKATQFKVNVNVVNIHGMSCFQLALSSWNANMIVRLLFRAGLSLASEDVRYVQRCMAGNSYCSPVDMSDMLRAAGFFPPQPETVSDVPSLWSISLQFVRSKLAQSGKPNLFLAVKELPLPNLLKGAVMNHVSLRVAEDDENDDEWW